MGISSANVPACFGIDYDIATGETRKIGWKEDAMVEVIDNGC